MEAKVAIVKCMHTPDRREINEMTQNVLKLIGPLDRIIKPGALVVIKGNFFAPYPPPVSVDRRVVGALTELCFSAGAGRVVLCEGVSIGTRLGHGARSDSIMEMLGVADEVRSKGGELVSLEYAERVSTSVPNAKSIAAIDYPKLLLECDVLVDLPCMKTHSMTLVTLGIKNFHGVMSDAQKYYAHRDDLEQKLVDAFKIRKPDLTLIDAITAMEGNGSGEMGLPHPMNMLIASTDVVAADAVAAACMGIEDPLDVTATRLADFEGIGCGKLEQITVLGEKISDVAEKFLLPDKFRKPQDRKLIGIYKNIDVFIGGACRMCWSMASATAAKLGKYPDIHFNLIVGSDPKIPHPEKLLPEETIFLGDCAGSTSGELLNLRQRMLI